MILIGLGLLVVVFFVVGIALIFRGYADTPAMDSMVKKEELDKSRTDLLAAREQQEALKLQLDTIAVELDKARERAEQSQKVEEHLRQLSLQESEYKHKIEELEAHLQFLTNKADTQAQEALEAISTLDAENVSLRNSAEQVRSQFDPQAIEKMQAENNKLRQQVDEHITKIKTLQADLEVTENQSRSKIKEADATIQGLTKDNSRIKEGLQQITSKIGEVQGELARSEQESAASHQQSAALESQVTSLQSQIAENKTKMQALESELAKSREQAAQAAQLLEEMRKNKEAVPERSAVTDTWPQGKNSFEEQLTRLKRLNELLTEKEKILQSELTRSRMKSLGWEKIVESLKSQAGQK